MKKLRLLFLCLTAACLPLMLNGCSEQKSSEAETKSLSTTSTEAESFEDGIEPSMLTQFDLVVCEADGAQVKAVLENIFTLFPSIVKVDLRLYSSTTKTTDISKMTLEGSATSADLNMGESISVIASTHNEDRYWVAYVLYYKSSTNIQTYQTDPAFFSADGTNYPAL